MSGMRFWNIESGVIPSLVLPLTTMGMTTTTLMQLSLKQSLPRRVYAAQRSHSHSSGRSSGSMSLSLESIVMSKKNA